MLDHFISDLVCWKDIYVVLGGINENKFSANVPEITNLLMLHSIHGG